MYRRLINECIKLFGIDTFYIPRTSESQLDLLFGDDPTKSFTGGYPIEMYIQNVEGFDGPNDLFTKYGLVIKKDLRLLVGNTAFQTATQGTLGVRPREGDLIWMPNFQALFEIKFCNADKFFYAFGSKPFYGFELSCEEFRYNNEVIDTGIPEIDVKVNELVTAYAANVVPFRTNTQPSFVFGEIVNGTLATATVVSFNRPSGNLILSQIKGEFSPNTQITGQTSNAVWTLIGIEVADNVNENLDNNLIIRKAANTDFDQSESNPFGNPVLTPDNGE